LRRFDKIADQSQSLPVVSVGPVGAVDDLDTGLFYLYARALYPQKSLFLVISDA